MFLNNLRTKKPKNNFLKRFENDIFVKKKKDVNNNNVMIFLIKKFP
jgi:hypothetical protein